MSAPMDMEQFAVLYDHIMRDHNIVTNVHKGVAIKYIYPSIDTRTGEVFSVNMRPWYSDKSISFYTVNDQRDLPDSLYDRVMKYLDGEENTGRLYEP